MPFLVWSVFVFFSKQTFVFAEILGRGKNMNVGLVSNTFGALTGGKGAQEATRMSGDASKFEDLVKHFQDKKSTISTSQIAKEGRLNGDVATGFAGTYKSERDKAAEATGAARNQANDHVQSKKIDKTSKLYEKSMELESYFVKQMLSAMRKTVSKSALGGDGFAGQMYEDMMFDEYATSMTKNAGFGLADQIYLSLV